MSGRRYPGQRALRITARTVHIASAGLVLGGALWDQDVEGWAAALVASGTVILVDDLYRYGMAYLRYAQGATLVAKLAIVGVGASIEGMLFPSLLVAVVAGSVISHAPGAVRHFALWGAPGPCAEPKDS